LNRNGFKEKNKKKMKKFDVQNVKDTRSGFGAGLSELGKSNPRVVALCADLTGSLKMDAFQKDHPERFFQVSSRPFCPLQSCP
jgi:transketolase